MGKILQPLQGLDPLPIQMDFGDDLIQASVLRLADRRVDDPDWTEDQTPAFGMAFLIPDRFHAFDYTL